MMAQTMLKVLGGLQIKAGQSQLEPQPPPDESSLGMALMNFCNSPILSLQLSFQMVTVDMIICKY